MRSQSAASDLLYLLEDDFTHPITTARFAGDDGVWQDGRLVVHFPAVSRWVALFLAFQSQAWHTDMTGHAIGGAPPRPTGGAAAGALLDAAVSQPVQLGNLGGSISLLDPAGLKVAGASYTAEQARQEGRTITF